VPPADFCNCLRRTGQKPGLSFPRRDEGLDLLPFLTRHARPLRVAPESGDTRRAAHSSDPRDPGAGSSRLREVARPRYLESRVTLLAAGRLSPYGSRKKVTETCTGLWTEQGRVPEHGGGDLRIRVREPMPTPTTFPSSGFQRTPLCRRCARSQRKRPSADDVRTGLDSRFSVRPRRRPVSCESRCLPPLRRESQERIAPSCLRFGPLSHAAHTFSPGWGEVL